MGCTTTGADIVFASFFCMGVIGMKVNGEQVVLEKDITVMSFLQEKKFRTDAVAVELNGEILPKKLYETTCLKNSDVMEIVQFMGGG